MQQNHAKDNNLSLLILKSVLTTLLFITVGVGFTLACLSYIAPQKLTGLYNDLELKDTESFMFKRVYEQSGKFEDLYNVIEVSLTNGNFADSKYYINIMQNRAGYNDFCLGVNQRNTKNCQANLYVYVCDYDAYLNAQYVNSLYNLGEINSAKNVGLTALYENKNVYSWEFGTFIGSIMTDNILTESAKKSTLEEIYNTPINGKTIQELIDIKLSSITSLEERKQSYIYKQIKLTNLYLARAVNNAELINSITADLT